MIKIEFKRMGKHTIKCLISEEEILDMGFSVEEIITNGERTQEFMNYIFDMAEQEFETKFDLGIKTVQVEFRSDHTLSLTFSEHPVAEGMMEHLKDIVSGLLGSIPQAKMEEIQRQQEQAKNNESKEPKDFSGGAEEVDIIVMLKFVSMDILIRFAKQVRLKKIPFTALIKYQNNLYLVMDLSNQEETEVKMLSLLTDEYAAEIQVGRQHWAFLEEHGTILLPDNAMEQLREL